MREVNDIIQRIQDTIDQSLGQLTNGRDFFLTNQLLLRLAQLLERHLQLLGFLGDLIPLLPNLPGTLFHDAFQAHLLRQQLPGTPLEEQQDQ